LGIFVNQKGGCGKNATAINIAPAFAQLGESISRAISISRPTELASLVVIPTRSTPPDQPVDFFNNSQNTLPSS
jgi:hypothetical protein